MRSRWSTIDTIASTLLGSGLAGLAGFKVAQAVSDEVAIPVWLWVVSGGLTVTGVGLFVLSLWRRSEKPVSPVDTSPTDAEIGRQLLKAATDLGVWKAQAHFLLPPLKTLQSHDQQKLTEWEGVRDAVMQNEYQGGLDWWKPVYADAVKRGFADSRLEDTLQVEPAKLADYDDLQAGLKAIAMRLIGATPSTGY